MRLRTFRGLLFGFPLLIVLGTAGEGRAQPRGFSNGFGVGIGVGYGWGYRSGGWRGVGAGPGWGWGPGWWPGYMGWAYQPPFDFYNGTWGNGLSLYGPPVPTGKPIPGMFGGGDSQFFPLPPLYPGWMVQTNFPLKPGPLPSNVFAPGEIPGEMLPPPRPPGPALDRPAPMEMEVHLPADDAKVFIDGEPTKATGAVRVFASPARPTAESLTYELRIEWKVDGLTNTATKRVVGHAGDRVVVEFKK